MKQFMLFIYDNYEPNGGMQDFVNSFDTVDEAIMFANIQADKYELYHIYDLENEEIVVKETRR